ncbi:RDD family protein [Nesterenkonia flava]|uniref:RDD family protein n=1 Tax=Nesterenkonia flava TaxID=469799 RepID=A0ABU1FWN3_9MICC|nr:RDD family protein [Nesterenkonia flava]MDR5713094.1 RDD family protein [Nesterenkonia flava]
MTDSKNDAGWPGDELGLPPEGPGSLAPFGLRVLALFIDWGLASLISLAWFAYSPWATLGAFVVMHVLLVGLLGVTVGKRLVRIQVVRGNSAPGPLWALVRVLLLMLVLPTLVISSDGRGAHDRIAGTVQLRM